MAWLPPCGSISDCGEIASEAPSRYVSGIRATKEVCRNRQRAGGDGAAQENGPEAAPRAERADVNNLHELLPETQKPRASAARLACDGRARPPHPRPARHGRPLWCSAHRVGPLLRRLRRCPSTEMPVPARAGSPGAASPARPPPQGRPHPRVLTNLQYHVAYSSSVEGAGIVAGGPYVARRSSLPQRS